MIFRKYEEILEEKDKIAQKKLKDAKPIVAMSVKEGILIFAANPDLKFQKIYEVYDRIVCAISGYRPDFMELYRPLVFAAENWAENYSEGDVAVKDLAEELAIFLKQRYENSAAPTPYIVNMALVEVAPVQNDDTLIHIDFKGDLKDRTPYMVLGSDLEKSELENQVKKFLNENTPINEALAEIVKKDKELRGANKGRLEIVFLNREKVLKKEFDEVFQRIDFEEKKK